MTGDFSPFGSHRQVIGIDLVGNFRVRFFNDSSGSNFIIKIESVRIGVGV